MHERRVVRVAADGLSSVYADLRLHTESLLNDLLVDPTSGRIYVGCFGYNL